MKPNGSAGMARPTPQVLSQQLSWAEAYEKRMRRFNLKVVLAALGAIGWLSVAWWLFQK
jgi:cytoskeletal protein RodZ